MPDIQTTYFSGPVIKVTMQSGIQGPPGGGGGGGGGVSDHGDLSGLADDDHTQYLNNARGDARYSPQGHTHTSIASVDITTLRLAIGGGQFLRITPVIEAGQPTLSLTIE